jgi:hypothetical protein
LYSIHEDTTAICHTKKGGKKNIQVAHRWKNDKWFATATAYYQGYAPPSYSTFANYVPGMSQEMIKEGGTSHQAHSPLRHFADVFHSAAWMGFVKKVNSGCGGVFVGSKYMKDL